MPNSGAPQSSASERPDSLAAARTALRAEHFERARALLVDVLVGAPTDPQALLMMAKVELGSGRYAAAAKLAEQALDAGAPAVDSGVVMALSTEARGKPGEALERIADLARAHPQSGLALFQHGRLLAAQGHSDESVRQLRLAFERCRRSDQRYQIACLIGSVLAELGHFADACTALRRAVELAPRRLRAYLALAEVFEKADDTSAALAVLDEAEQRTSGAPELWQRHSELLVAAGDLPAARRRANWLCATRQSDADSWLQAAGLALRDGDEPAALTAAQRARELQPTSPAAHHLLGVIHDAAARSEQAEGCFRAALQLEPAAWWVANDLALVLLTRADVAALTEAQALFERAVALSEEQRHEPLLNLAIASAKLGQRDRCEALCERLDQLPLPAATRERVAALRAGLPPLG